MAVQEQEEIANLILDLGSGTGKVGLGTDDMPRAVIPTLWGTVRKGCQQVLNADSDKIYVGSDVIKNSSILDVHNIVDGGIVSNWVAMPAFVSVILTHVVHTDAENLNIVITEPPNNPVSNGLEAARTFFNMGFHGMQRVVQANMVLYSNGMTTGCVLDSGAGCTHIMPVFQGYTDKKSGGNTRIAGNNIDQMVVNSFGTEHGMVDLQSSGNAIYIAQKVKEECMMISLNYQEELQEYEADTSKNKDYTLPDGQVISVGKSRIMCPEVLFRPGELLGLTSTPVDELCKTSYDKLNIDMRKTMISTQIVSGGTSMMQNFPERINIITVDIVAPELKNQVKIMAEPSRLYSVWLGTSILGSLDHFPKCIITKSEWEEDGDTVVIRKSMV